MATLIGHSHEPGWSSRCVDPHGAVTSETSRLKVVSTTATPTPATITTAIADGGGDNTGDGHRDGDGGDDGDDNYDDDGDTGGDTAGDGDTNYDRNCDSDIQPDRIDGQAAMQTDIPR